MAHYNHEDVYPGKAASAMAQWVPVTLVGDETVRTTASLNELSIGFTIASVASPNDSVAFVTDGKCKAVAAASLGAGARLAVGSTNGVLIPLAASAGAAPTAVRYVAAIAMQAAQPGDVFTVLVDPDEII